jgi:predicted transcriptional regulator
MMAARLAQRRTNTIAAAAPPPQPTVNTNRPQFKSMEEMKEFYRQKNLELIRAGGKKGPPLPVALSPEDDAQLVKEGVLPPNE